MLTLQEASLDWALAHVETFGDTDVFPTPFEYEAIRHDWDTLKTYLAEQNILEWKVRPPRTLLSPKARYGFRVITQLDPLDFLLFAALIREICNLIEDRRIPQAAKIVHSYRAAPTRDGRLFDREVGYRSFLIASRNLLEESPQFSHVVMTDIADFYSRIYHHRLENALHAATAQTNHVKAIMHLLSGWNGTETFGIPVGSAPSRLLAELTISDIDSALLANDVQFIRFNDDYRIFVQSHTEAYRILAFLADSLFRNHGLTLQQQKTTVLTCEEFKFKFLATASDRELDSLHDKFDHLIAELDLKDPYENIDYEDLTENQKKVVDSLNLKELLDEQICDEEDIDISLVRFLLHRLAQLGDRSAVDELLSRLDVLYPVFPDIVSYIERLSFLGNKYQTDIGKKLLDVYEDSIASELEYHKLWCLDPFSRSQKWGQNDRLFRLYSRASDDTSRRKLILAMGRAEQQHWFQGQWRNLMNFPPWLRRAVLAGSSCMPPDARKHWYHSIEPQLDILERAVVKWARQNPFSEG